MKGLCLLSLLMFSVTLRAQVDSSGAMSVDSLSPDQLLEYYLNEPEPIQFYKGPITGDSTYMELNPLTIPTETVYGDPLRRTDEQGNEINSSDSSSNPLQLLKPKITIGMGKLAFHGDLREKHFQSPTTGRLAFDLSISQRLTRYLQLDFNVLFGKLGAGEWLDQRHENFQSEIRAGGVNLMYDFGNFIPDKYRVRPFLSVGVMGFEFLSKTDLKDKFGNTYYYWNDGTIRNQPEGSPGAQFAKELIRDYNYESDIRELNRDGFGKYPERAWSVPLGAGVIMKVTDRTDFKFNFQYFFSSTDYIDGIAGNSVGARRGNTKNDNFTYTSFSIQYDLIANRKRKLSAADTLGNDFWLAFDKDDMDMDGITDFKDDCPGTAQGAAVDELGCPLDDDRDGIPNYRDDELNSAIGAVVNGRGVTQNDAYWQAWYDDYMNDSTATERITEQVGNIYTFNTNKKKRKKEKENYTIELVRYTGPIPSDELAFLLSIGDITSTTLEDGTTVVYTSGNFEKVSTAVKRRDEFRTQGNKGAGVSKISGNNIVQLEEDELEKLLKSELEDLLGVNAGDGVESEDFSKDEIVYRVQLGAFKNKISTSVFNTSAGVLELKTGESVYRYVTKGYRTIEQAASVRADLVVQGYSDAFVTAYKNGKRIPMSETKATVDKDYKEDLNENKIFSSIDKKLLTFKVQLGPLKKKALESLTDEKVKDLAAVEKQTTASGSLRYTSGSFATFEEAEAYKKELENKGFVDGFVIAMFKNEIVSIQEAMELLK